IYLRARVAFRAKSTADRQLCGLQTPPGCPKPTEVRVLASMLLLNRVEPILGRRSPRRLSSTRSPTASAVSSMRRTRAARFPPGSFPPALPFVSALAPLGAPGLKPDAPAHRNPTVASPPSFKRSRSRAHLGRTELQSAILLSFMGRGMGR